MHFLSLDREMMWFIALGVPAASHASAAILAEFAIR
jgi:hypothetical protein